MQPCDQPYTILPRPLVFQTRIAPTEWRVLKANRLYHDAPAPNESFSLHSPSSQGHEALNYGLAAWKSLKICATCFPVVPEVGTRPAASFDDLYKHPHFAQPVSRTCRLCSLGFRSHSDDDAYERSDLPVCHSQRNLSGPCYL